MSSKRPEQVQRKLEAAEALEAKLAAEQAALNPPAEEDPEQPAEPPIDPTPEPPAAESPPEPPRPAADDAWEQRYKTLKGMFDKKVSDTATQIQGLEARIAMLSKPTVPETEAVVSQLTQADRDAFGDDLIDVVKRAAAEVAANIAAPLRAQNQQLEQELTELRSTANSAAKQAGQVAEREFYEGLDKRVPNWKTVNAEPGFLAWLAEQDPLYGVVRQQSLTEAFEDGDFNRVAGFFENWTREVGYAAPAPTPPAPAVDPTLAKQITPGNSRSTTAPTPANTPKMWTNAEVKEFYRKRNRRELSTEEAMRIEAEIDLALSEGRVAP